MKARGRGQQPPAFAILWHCGGFCGGGVVSLPQLKTAHRPVKREKGATPSGGSPFYVMRQNMALAKHPTVLRQTAR